MSIGTNHRTRVVITGLGIISPLGDDIDTIWNALIQGESGITQVTMFDTSNLPCQIAGEIPNFNPTEFIPSKQARRMSRTTQLGLAAAQKAIQDASLLQPFPNPERVGVYFGTAIGGLDRADQALSIFRTSGLSKVNPFYIPSALPNMPAFHISQEYGALGVNNTISTACATGTQVVGEAAHAIQMGRADVIISGSTEALVQDFAIAAFSILRALPRNYNNNPEHASRPFDAKREGFVLSEGSACLILESFEHAVKRNARIYAEVIGYASSNDAYHIAAPDPTAKGAVRTMKWALEDAGVKPEQVSYINAHGTSTPANDAVETKAIKELFAEHAYRVPISSTKSMIGHAMGASGAIEASVCALSIQRGMLHPTINYEFPDPDLDLDYIPNQARDQKVEYTLSNSFGLGGQNACVVLKHLEAS